ncbi:protein phosphatase 2C domain-containing protein [Streptomyces sp. NBC_00091]|uniref:protein phosphatase 2C domain-containing protein n=1 Tax=Streptomyces sp. NBC_00091 TaxID=2975648 RepID=UPI002251EF43|nr:protein phosphatase 2C domain-containing protein [Streptomyces sp. NBC_00091]MCX5378306.1 protein phosphatase 2C domain-containing protein [Streptomyces sp. NBC_00091]
MSMHRPSGCPSCAEPLEEGDRFCGVCGYALSSAPPPADPTPTLPVTPTPGAVGRAADEPAAYPAPAPVAAAPVAPAPVGAAYSAVGPAGSEAPGYGVPAPGWEGEAEPGRGAAPWDSAGAGHEDPYGGAPQGDPQEAPYGAGATRHDPPGSAGGTGTPSEGTPWGAAGAGAGHEDPDPYGAAPQGEPQGDGKTCVACRAGHVDTDGYCEHCGHAQPRERDHLEEELCSVAAVSDRGLRHHRNEDSFAVSATALPDGSAATVAIVCDGVSSASRPDEASAAAAAAANEALLEALPHGAHPAEAMHEAILAASAAVNALAPETPGAQNAPACTLVGAVVSSGVLTIGWVGDSRAYWVPDDRGALPRRLTEDDSWAAQMVAAGLMGEAEAYADVRAHAITGWLGADAYDLEPHTASFRPDHPGVVVVCTDGLWNYAESAREMARVLPVDAAARPLHSAQVLVGHALDGGGHDNVTVAVVPFSTPEQAQPQAPAETGTEAGTEAEAEPQARPRA